MKIVIVSDSHGNREILEKIVLQNPSANIFLHAGDSGLCKLEISPYVSVKGNCDYESDFPDKLIIKTPYGNLYMSHGNRLYEINSHTLEKNNAKIFVFGHTHQHLVEKIDDCYIFNPGSVSLPRDGTNGTYLVLDITSDDVSYEFIYL